MDKDVSIVLSAEAANPRKLAQTWYNLTDEQMKDCDVHHNPPRHKGGRNVPEHLYVYHTSVHSAVHGDGFTKWARKGAQKLHEIKDEKGRSIAGVRAAERLHRERDDRGRSLSALKPHLEKDEKGRSVTAMKAHLNKTEEGKSAHGIKTAEHLNSQKNTEGKSINAQKGGKRGAQTTNSQKYVDPDHPELGIRSPGTLVLMQKARGLPSGPGNREKVRDG